MDPSPFRERDLDPAAAEFIVDWAAEVPGAVRLGLVVYLDRPTGAPDEPAILRDAIPQFFARGPRGPGGDSGSCSAAAGSAW